MPITPSESWLLEIGVIAAAWQVKAALLLCIVLLVQRGLTDSSAAFRRRVWAAGLTAALLLPALGSWLPSISLDVPYVAAVLEEAEKTAAFADRREALAPPVIAMALVAEAVDAVSGHADGAAASSSAVTAGTIQGANSAHAAPATGGGDRSWFSLRDFFTALAIVWAIGVLARLGWLAYEMIRVRLQFRGAVPLPAGRLRSVAEDALRHLPRRRRVHLVVSQSENVLCTYGVVRPIIVLPAGADGWPDDRLQVAILHEVMHIRAFDYLVLLLSEIACAFYWPNPLVWLARRRLQEEQEEACDAEVIHSGVRPVDYASHLVEIARLFHRSAHECGATLPLARRRRLESRVHSILRQRGLPPGVPVPSWAAVALGLASVVVPVSMLHPGRAPVTADEMAASPYPEIAFEPVEIGKLANATVAWWDAVPRLENAPIPRPVASVRGPATGIGVPHASYAWLEAEELVSDRRLIGHDRNDVSGGLYVDLPGSWRRAEDAALTAEIQVVQSGPHYLWARVQQPGRRGGDLRIAVNGGDAVEWQLPRVRAERRSEWSWVRLESGRRSDPLPLMLDAGTHELTVWARDADVHVDGIVVTFDPMYVPRGAPPVLPPAEPVHIWLEAEHASWSDPFVMDRARDGFQFLHVDTRRNTRDAPPTDASAIFRFQVDQAGTYLVWARTLVRRFDGDSFWVRVNDGAWIAWNDLPRDRDWQWSEIRDPNAPGGVAQFTLQPGENTIEFAHREGGPRLDRVLVTNDPRFSPRNRETPTQTAARTPPAHRDSRTS